MINCAGCLMIILMCAVDTDVALDFVLKDSLVTNKKLQVVTSSGVVQGARETTLDLNVTYYKFLGIPYAAPPVGPLRWKVYVPQGSPSQVNNLRFALQPPVPHDKWAGVLNATKEGSICVQMSTELGTEDCLFLNVYTPQNIEKLNETSPIAVMVWIHGGRFANGFSNYSVYGPDYLLEHGVAFVSFNYRLGIFGFLSTEDLEVPGNFGIKDQIEALTWIQKNIRNFGGDPDKVTIFGESAGGACVSYLMLTPLANGLFHRAISESGSALCPWAFQREPKKIAIKLAHACGIYETNSTLMVDKLRAEDAKKLRSRATTINIGNMMEPLNGLPFAPCIEPAHNNAVLTNRSNELFSKGLFNAVPYMIGFTSQEASIGQDTVEITRLYIAHWDMLPQLLVPINLNITSKNKRKEVATKIKEYYFGKKFISMSTKTEMMNFIGDSQFVRSIRHNIQICAPYTTIYFYVFSYEGYIGRFGTKNEISRKVKGAGHVEDLFYIFKKANLITKNLTDLAVIGKMTVLWTNFAKEGNPTPLLAKEPIYWPPININDTSLKYLDIDSSLSVKQNPRAEAMDFWDDLYKDYGNKKYDTY